MGVVCLLFCILVSISWFNLFWVFDSFLIYFFLGWWIKNWYVVMGMFLLVKIIYGCLNCLKIYNKIKIIYILNNLKKIIILNSNIIKWIII